MSIVSNDTKLQFYNDPLNAMLPPSLMALFPNTGWYLLYLYMCLYLNDFFTFYLEVSSQMRALCMMGTRMICNFEEKKPFTQNNNNHTKEITFSMCPPLRF